MGGGHGLSLSQTGDRPGAGKGGFRHLRLYGGAPRFSGGHCRLAKPTPSLGHRAGRGHSHIQCGSRPLHRRRRVYGAGRPGDSPATGVWALYRSGGAAGAGGLQQRAFASGWTVPGELGGLRAPGGRSQSQADAFVQPPQSGGESIYPGRAGTDWGNLQPASGDSLCRRNSRGLCIRRKPSYPGGFGDSRLPDGRGAQQDLQSGRYEGCGGDRAGRRAG